MCGLKSQEMVFTASFAKQQIFFQVTMALLRPLFKPCLAYNVKRRVTLMCGLKCQEMAFKWHLQLLWLNIFLGDDPPDPLSVTGLVFGTLIFSGLFVSCHSQLDLLLHLPAFGDLPVWQSLKQSKETAQVHFWACHHYCILFLKIILQPTIKHLGINR